MAKNFTTIKKYMPFLSQMKSYEKKVGQIKNSTGYSLSVQGSLNKYLFHQNILSKA